MCVIYDAIVTGELDYMCFQKYSMPSIDQPGHGACVLGLAM